MSISRGTAVIYAAPPPRCPVHGQMSYCGSPICRWECRGYDGEGCNRVVTDEEIHYEYIGYGEITYG